MARFGRWREGIWSHINGRVATRATDYTQDGKPHLKFRVIVNRYEQGKRVQIPLTVTILNDARAVDFAIEVLEPGDYVQIYGELKTYTGDDGKERLELLLDDLNLMKKSKPPSEVTG